MKESSPAKKLLFPEPFLPTTTLCLGEKGSIWVWSRSASEVSDKSLKKIIKRITGLESLDGKGLDVHVG